MKELTIQTKNLELSALLWGDEDSPPVIALHGWLDNAASFVPIATHLKGVRIIALDMPGHGKSQHRDGVNAYHFIDYAADVILAADALGLDRFSLLGHSLGAGVAGVIAAAVPQRINRLAMVEGLAPVTGSSEKMLDQFRLHIDRCTKPTAGASLYKNIDEAALARQRAGNLSFSSAKLIAERNLTQFENGFTWRTDRCLRQPSPIYLVEDHVRSYLQMIQCDTLLVRSSEGIIKNWKSLQGRERYLKHLTVVDIRGGHHCHMDNPESVAQHVAPFLTENDQESTLRLHSA